MPDNIYIVLILLILHAYIYIYTFPSKGIGGFVYLCIDFVHRQRIY